MLCIRIIITKEDNPVKNKIVKSETKKPESDVTLKQQIITLKQQNMRLQNKTLAQENKILKLEQKILRLETENDILKKEKDSHPGLMQTVVAALKKIEKILILVSCRRSLQH